MKTIGSATVQKSGNTTTTIPVPASGVAAGHTVVVAVMAGTFKGTVACTDSKGNSYTVDSDVTGQGRLFVCTGRNVAALAAGDKITATYPGFSGMSIAGATEFSHASGVDQRRVATGNSAAPTVGPVGTTHSNELLVSVVAHSSTPVFTAACGFAPASRAVGGTGGGQKTIDVGYRAAPAAGSYTACGTMTSGTWWSAGIVTYW